MGSENEHRRGFEAAAVAQGHPLLTSWNPPTQHSFSRTQMTTLSSLCDAFSPSIDPPEAPGSEEASNVKVSDKSAFYGSSASDMGIPQDIAGLLSVLLKPSLVAAIRVVLWLLSTRLGTVILGGRASLTWEFPFFHSFCKLPRANQETILRRWSLSVFGGLRALYKLFKMITLWAVYAKIEKDGHNRNWNAIGYCGADPHLTKKPTTDPLKNVVVTTEKKNLTKVLNRAGIPITSSENSETRISCDVVVVGSGSGGGVAASVLAKAGHKVVVLEKGRHFSSSDFSTLEGPSQMAMLEKLGSLATDDGGVNLVAGATVGGGTTVNWSVCFETPPHVLEEWKELTNLELFTSTRYQIAMKEVWRRLGAQPHVSRENLQNAALRLGCERLGEEVGTLARNAPPDHECGWCTSGCGRGQKGSTATTWLVDAAETGNAVVLAECEAERVVYSKNSKPGKKKPLKARGVIAKAGHTKLVIEARAVVAACGSLMTPPLLLRSGLRNPSIGRNLHLHPVVFVWGYFPEGQGPPGTCYEGAIMTSYSPVWKRGASRATPGALLEVPSTHPGSFASFQPWTSGTDFKERMARFSRTITLCVVTRDESIGKVDVDGNGDPMITYSLNEADECTALDGMEKGLRVLIAAGASEIGTHQQDGERFRITDVKPKEIDAYLKRVRERGVKKNQISMGSGHHMSSCTMGSNPKRSVVDGDGESWEVEGLFVSDGSVLPNAVGVNPMVTIQTLAYCIAHNVLQILKTP